MKPFLLLLVFLNVGFAVLNFVKPAIPATTYVLTPMVDILPEGAPLDSDEQKNLLSELRHQADARDMQQAYSRLGATLSLYDILRGIGNLDKSDYPLSRSQKQRIEKLLTHAQDTHTALRVVQKNILDIERTLATQLSELENLGEAREME
ncbi:MAG: hypothetical protein VX026_01500 [Myxococcota bacterium]|nr:hypothetical protein [Myxococcota bacterium]